MDIQEILERASSMASISETMSKEEWERYKADDFNKQPGFLNEADGYNCPQCLNRGYFMRAAQNTRGWWTTEQVTCKCMAVRRTIERMKKSGLKDIIKDYTFDKYEATEPWQKTVKDAAMDYAKEPIGWFFIGGQPGIGKTHLCTAICRDFLLSGREVKYMLWRDEAPRLKALVNDPEYSAEIKPYKEAEVLYIDDLFKTGKTDKGEKQQPTGGDINLAFELLNYRYNDQSLLTIISSECTINNLLDIDEAVGSRVAERAKVLSMKPDRSKNYRLKGTVEL